MKYFPIKVAAVAVAIIALSATTSAANGSHSGGHESSSDIGQPGDMGHIDRTIGVEMGEMFFRPEDYGIRSGETIRFVVTNSGEFVHEFSLGTEKMHMGHASEMMDMMESGAIEADRIDIDMMNASGNAHDDPNSLLLEPGKVGELIWTFNGDAAVEISCNLPGHRESGMTVNLNMMAQ